MKGTSARAEFDIAALYAAVDVQRQARGLNWAQAVREINAEFARVPCRPIAVSTVTGMRGRRALDGDTFLQVLIWLDRTPESLVTGGEAAVRGARLPRVGPSRILRFDARAIHAALDAVRVARGLTWRDVALAIGGLNAPSLSRLANGGRVGFPDVTRIARWLGRPVASLTRASER